MDYDRSSLSETQAAVQKFVQVYRKTPHSALGGIAPVEAHRSITLNKDRYLFEDENAIVEKNNSTIDKAFYKYKTKLNNKAEKTKDQWKEYNKGDVVLVSRPSKSKAKLIKRTYLGLAEIEEPDPNNKYCYFVKWLTTARSKDVREGAMSKKSYHLTYIF